MKHCNRCNADKDDSEFYKKQGCKDGLYSQCKKCCLEIKKLYALKKAEDIGIQYYPNLVCACGCGKQIQIKECHTRFGIPKYIHGHSTKGISKFQPLDLTKDYFCQCGCGEKIVIKRSHRFKQGIPKYIIGHQSRGEDNPCWGGGKINLVCEVCGKLFKVNKYRIVNNNIICCSRDCAGKVKRKVLGQDAIVLNYISGEGGDEWITEMFKAKALQAAFDASDKGDCGDDVSYFAGELIDEYIRKVRQQKDTYYQEEDY